MGSQTQEYALSAKLQPNLSQNQSSLKVLKKENHGASSGLNQNHRRHLSLLLNPLKDYEDAKYASRSHGNLVSYAANTHQGIQRSYNEDRISIILNMSRPESKMVSINNGIDQANKPKWPKVSFFAIYDGHGGSSCADFLKEQLHSKIVNQPSFPENVPQAITDGCAQAEEKFLDFAQNSHVSSYDKSGSCAIVIIVVENHIYCANVGDSRAIMSAEHGKKLFILSKDHKPNDESEHQRILSHGG